jgi:hypothetical protein
VGKVARNTKQMGQRAHTVYDRSIVVCIPKRYRGLPLAADKLFSRCARITFTLNVMVKWSAHLLRVRQVPSSDLGLETGHSDWISWFCSSRQMSG